MSEHAYRARQRTRLEEFLKVRADEGEDRAREVLVAGYLQGQNAVAGTHTEGVSLAEGFAAVRPMIEKLGIKEEFVDVSAEGQDVAIAIQTTCTCRNACTDAGLEERLPVLCEAYAEATRRAFPELAVEVLLRQVEGAHVCVFRYSRSGADAAGGGA